MSQYDRFFRCPAVLLSEKPLPISVTNRTIFQKLFPNGSETKYRVAMLKNPEWSSTAPLSRR